MNLYKKLDKTGILLTILMLFGVMTFALSANADGWDDSSGYYDSGSGYDSGYNYNSDSNYGYVDNNCYDCNSGSSYSAGFTDTNCYTCGNYNTSYYSSSNSNCTTCNNQYVPPVVQPYIPPVVQPAQLIVSCSPSNYSLNIGDSMTWNAYVSGGVGSNNYSWSGTDGLSGSGNYISKSYSNSGSKVASVTVTSGNQTQTATCSAINVNNNNNNYYNNNLDASCSISNTSVNVGDSVYVTAYGTGGNGSYTYNWNGDYPLGGRNGNSQSITYDSSGSKNVSVTVYSNGMQVTRSCGTVYVGNNNYNYNNYNYNSNYVGDLNISCTVNSATAPVGQNVSWTTSVTGGNGNYNYSWTGTDGLYGNSSIMSKVYSLAGIKTARVTVNSGGYTKSLDCPTVSVGPVGTLASLSSVYLNQVPYTGIGDNPKLVSFIVGLILFSALAAYVIVRRKVKTDRKKIIDLFKATNKMNKGI